MAVIYEIRIDGNTAYYPNDEECVVLNAKLEQALNDAGTIEFDIPKGNPCYENIIPRKSMIQVFKDKVQIFNGEVREVKENLDFTKSIYAVGELAFLFDSIQPQARYQDCEPMQFFASLVQKHNAQVEEKKRFEVGYCTVKDPNDKIYRYTNYEDTLSAIRDKLCDRLDGYLRVRWQNGKRYLDCVKLIDYGATSSQVLEFGENLLEYAASTGTEALATAILPLGARLEDVQNVDGLDSYTTIESVNEGKDYVFSQDAVDRFGWVKKVMKWDDVTIPENLKKKAEEYLESAQFQTLTLELNALDMSALDSDIDSYEVGDSILARAKPFGMNTYFPVQKKTIYLQEHDKNYVTLGSSIQKSFTDQSKKELSELEYELPQTSTILTQAKKNASELIKAGNEGYIYTMTDSDGHPYELLILDNPEYDKAQKVWRWNMGGLGYSNTGYDGEYGLAITMDGAIVADFITAGKMSGDIIKGGTIEVGGPQYDPSGGVNPQYSGVIRVLSNDAKKELVRIDKDGLELDKDVQINFNNITDGVRTGTQITENWIKTVNVYAQYLKAGSVDAEKITGSTITGKTISGGTVNGATITNGNITINNGTISAGSGSILYGNIRALDKNGHDIGSIYGVELSSGNLLLNGALYVKDPSYKVQDYVRQGITAKVSATNGDDKIKLDFVNGILTGYED